GAQEAGPAAARSGSGRNQFRYSTVFLRRKRTVKQPCVATAGNSCTASSMTTSFDALNRPVTVTDGGGGTINYTYSDNDVYQDVGPPPTGENDQRKQLQYDALGRLLSVCEVTST